MMTNVLGVDIDTFLNKDICKVYVGKAGAGKSSVIDRAFKENNEKYDRDTSTNLLAKDASERYGMTVKTIASHLFINKPFFYCDYKEITSKNLVVDEALQSNPKIWGRLSELIGSVNVIVTTDDRQLLAPENADIMMKEYQNFISRDDVLVIRINKSLRPRDEETRDMFDYWYDQAENDYLVTANEIISQFDTIDFEDVPFNPDTYLLCHTKMIEHRIYQHFDTQDYSLPLVPKGGIASRPPKNIELYPILSQMAVEELGNKCKSYYQVKFISTVNRMQGSEVRDDQLGIYFIEKNSKVSSREFYTFVTRFWKRSCIRICVVDFGRAEEMKTFNGLPVKEHKYLIMDYSGNTSKLSRKDMEELVSPYDTESVYNDRDVVYSTGGYIAYCSDSYKLPDKSPHAKAINIQKSKIGGLMRKDGNTNYTFMSDVYRCIEKHNLDAIRYPHAKGKRTESNYQVDLYSAYQSVIYNCEMPKDGIIKYEYDANMINFYKYTGNIITSDCIVNDDLREYLECYEPGCTEYMFSTPKTEKTRIGETFHNMAYKSIESKAELKQVHWGYLQKKYLEKKGDCYVIEKNNKYEIFMIQVTSILLLYMLTLKDALSANFIQTDAVHFDSLNDYTLDTIKSILPEWMDWRLKHNTSGEVIYQTYENLKAEKELNAEKSKARRDSMTDEEKAKEKQRSHDKYMERKMRRLGLL